MNIAQIALNRHTCKVYDDTKTISPEQIEQLITLLRYAPSSVNSQPWHFIIAASSKSKALVAQGVAEFNQPRIINASHIIVFCIKTPLPEQHINQITEQEQLDGRFIDEATKQAIHKARQHYFSINSGSPEQLQHWQEKQLYLALGTLLLGAATLGIDATPIEGFDANKMDILLDLPSKGLKSIVVAALGYRSTDDFNAKLPKSRLPLDKTVTFL